MNAIAFPEGVVAATKPEERIMIFSKMDMTKSEHFTVVSVG